MKSTKQPIQSPPIVVAIPSTTESKMRAIVALCQAVSDLARTLNSTNVDVAIKDCVIHGSGRAPGISVQ